MDFKNNLPRHIAIIMDGNKRWARLKGLSSVMGHRAGIDAARRITEACVSLNIPILTLYTFSTENWQRPKKEVDILMRMLKEFLRKELDVLKKNNIRLNLFGRMNGLPNSVKEILSLSQESTRSNSKLVLNLALNYSGRQEIVDAVKKIADSVRKGIYKLDDIDETLISNNLYSAGLPDPDLLIRTSGEMRISNFLLWQISYSELYITKKLWPDFTAEDLKLAIESYQGRDRRFGR